MISNDTKSIELTECPLCGSKDFSLSCEILGHSDFKSSFHLCNKCYIVFLSPKPSAEWLDEFYNNVYYSEDHRKKMGWNKNLLEISPQNLLSYERRMNFIEKHMPNKLGGRLLDLGCSVGWFLNEAAGRYWEVYGIEISDKAADVARNQLMLNVKTGVLEDTDFTDGFFEVVTAWDVIEHVPDLDHFMRNVKRILKRNGLFVLNTPNINSSCARLDGPKWRHLDAPLHLALFDMCSIRILFNKYGFDCLEVSAGDEYLGQLNAVARKL